MSLSAIIRAVGGDLYEHGRRAVIPGPGHSRHDRSVSLLLSKGRVVVHSFGRSTWREVMDELRTRGLVDDHGRPSGGSGGDWSPISSRSREMRTDVASKLWAEAVPLQRQLSLAHVRRRGIARPPPVSAALRHHNAVPAAVYAWKGPRRPALLATVLDAAGDLCAVELTYLDEDGARARGLSISRKVIGALPSGCAVRLDPVGPELLVGEGVFTTLSAAARFALPGWALLSTRNLRTWEPPGDVRRVTIAGDRGVDGERSARLLERRLSARDVPTRVLFPPAPAGDWNELDLERGRS